MKTNETLNAIREASRSAYFLMRDTMKRQAETLVSFITEDRFEGDNNPATTVKRFVEEIGKTNVQVIIATLVNIKAWDGRISRYNAEWAEGIEDSFDEQAGLTLHLAAALDKIHPAHLDQIADEMRTFQ